MEHLLVVDNLCELKTVMPGSARYVQTAGHTNPSDGGEGLFLWNPQSARPNDGTLVSSKHTSEGHWQRVFSGSLNVRWFGAHGNGTDATEAIQTAVDQLPQGGTLLVPSGTYLISQPIELHQGVALIGDGLFSVLRYSGPPNSGCLKSKSPAKSMAFHLARLNIEVHTAGAYGVDIRGMSYSRFDDLHIHLRANQSSGFYGPGNTVSPYYNLFTACHIAGAPEPTTNDCVGFNFTFDEPMRDQSANANSIIGGRISTCQSAVRCYGTGNMFYGQVLESNEDGYVFDVPPRRREFQQVGTSNDIIGCYSEHVKRVIVQLHGNCYLNALLTMVTGYEMVFDGVDSANCVVITSHDGSLPQSRSFVNRRIDFSLIKDRTESDNLG